MDVLYLTMSSNIAYRLQWFSACYRCCEWRRFQESTVKDKKYRYWHPDHDMICYDSQTIPRDHRFYRLNIMCYLLIYAS